MTTNRDRKAWAQETARYMNNRCMGCGLRSDVLHVHEIERRSHAKNWAHRCNYLLICRICHAWEFDCMPHAKQLAHKLYWDIGNFDLTVWLKLRDPELKAPNRVTIEEVEEHLPYLRERFG